jgi:hypothetical protein
MRSPSQPAPDEACARLWRAGGRPLEDWTNHQLDCLYECGPDCRTIALEAIAAEAANLVPELNDYSRQFLEDDRQFREDQHRDAASWTVLVERRHAAHLRRLENAILGAYSQGRPKGRPKGSAPGLAEANVDIERIKGLWQRTFGTWRRNRSPTVREIAAHRNGIKLKKLVEYRKNYPKLSRS